MPGLAPAGDLLSCSCKKVGKEARPAAPALRAEGSPESRPFARRKANQLALRNPALTPRCGRPAGPVAKLAGQKAAVVGQRDRTTPGEPSSLGGSEGNGKRRACKAVPKMNPMRTRQSSRYCVQKRRHPVLGGVLSGYFVPQRTGWTGRLETNASSLVRT